METEDPLPISEKDSPIRHSLTEPPASSQSPGEVGVDENVSAATGQEELSLSDVDMVDPRIIEKGKVKWAILNG